MAQKKGGKGCVFGLEEGLELADLEAQGVVLALQLRDLLRHFAFQLPFRRSYSIIYSNYKN
jgi:hypothetical protein